MSNRTAAIIILLAYISTWILFWLDYKEADISFGAYMALRSTDAGHWILSFIYFVPILIIYLIVYLMVAGIDRLWMMAYRRFRA